MNKTQVAKLLTIASAVDNRRVEPETVNAWFELIGDLPVDVALQAVRMHQRESDEYLMPVHVRRNALKVFADRDKAYRRERLDFLFESSEKARAIEPPKCEHDLVIAQCLPCSLVLAGHV